VQGEHQLQLAVKLMAPGRTLRFKVRENQASKPKHFALGGLVIDSAALRAPLHSVLYHPPVIFVVPGHDEHTVLLETIKGTLDHSVPISRLEITVKTSTGDKKQPVDSATLPLAILDHHDKSTGIMTCEVCFSDRLIHNMIKKFRDRNEDYAAYDPAAWACGIISWHSLKKYGLASPLHNPDSGFAVLRLPDP
jgi:hypothetical protein